MGGTEGQDEVGLTGNGRSRGSSLAGLVEVGRAAFSFSVNALPFTDDEEGRDDDEVALAALPELELPLDGLVELPLGRDDEADDEPPPEDPDVGLVDLSFAARSDGISTGEIRSSIKYSNRATKHRNPT